EDAHGTTLNVGALNEGLDAVPPDSPALTWWIPVLVLAATAGYFTGILWWARRRAGSRTEGPPE
ncbi:MAG: hypothetical protein R3291_02935, partial [Thermoplasmata archaeon]|nr:hypothetical protein [Thermoplasmata archaeon]